MKKRVISRLEFENKIPLKLSLVAIYSRVIFSNKLAMEKLDKNTNLTNYRMLRAYQEAITGGIL